MFFMEADYTSATLYFPGFWDGDERITSEEFFPFDGRANYTIDDLVIEAMLNFTLPEEIRGVVNVSLKDKLASRVFEKLKKDLSGATEQLGGLRKLMRKGIILPRAHFHKAFRGYNFYDCSNTPKLGDILMKIKGSCAKDRGGDVFRLAEGVVRRGNEKSCHVFGETLPEAVQKMVEIYSAAEEIDNYLVKR